MQLVPPPPALAENFNYKVVAMRFPHVGQNLATLWGSKECLDYLHELTIDNRGNRHGFDQDSLFAIIKLIEQHDKEFPKFTKSSDIWEDDGRRPLR